MSGASDILLESILIVMIPIVDRLDGIPGSGDPTEDSDHRSLPRRVRSVEQTIHSIKS